MGSRMAMLYEKSFLGFRRCSSSLMCIYYDKYVAKMWRVSKVKILCL